MIFEQKYSSSKGNLYYVTASNGRKLLIDPGVSWKRLSECGLTDIEAVICGHLHKDHSRSLKDVAKAKISVYASRETLESQELLRDPNTHVVAGNTLVKLDSFQVLAFKVCHDCKEPLGYIVREKATNEYLLFAVDTNNIEYDFRKFKFSIVAIECSYDIKILQQRLDSGEVNEYYARRLISSHLEKLMTRTYLSKFCDLSKCREIHLLHLSDDNIDREATMAEFEKEFKIKTIICNTKPVKPKTLTDEQLNKYKATA